MGAYLELEMGDGGGGGSGGGGEGRGMRVGTLGLVVRGLWEGMVGGRRWVEVGFEVWYVFLSFPFCFVFFFFLFLGRKADGVWVFFLWGWCRDENHEHVGEGIIANEESSLSMSS